MVYPGTLFHRRQRGIPMHSYENRGGIRALHTAEVGSCANFARAASASRCAASVSTWG
jgi:hypothetical protein